MTQGMVKTVRMELLTMGNPQPSPKGCYKIKVYYLINTSTDAVQRLDVGGE